MIGHIWELLLFQKFILNQLFCLLILYENTGKGHISKIFPILQARVPVVKVVDSGTGIECDISVENKDGVSRSSIFTIISSIDERFQILSYLVNFIVFLVWFELYLNNFFFLVDKLDFAFIVLVELFVLEILCLLLFLILFYECYHPPPQQPKKKINLFK